MVQLTDDFVEAVEERIGMGHRAWDMVDPKRIIEAVAILFRVEDLKAELRIQAHKAYVRADYRTNDRIANLLGEMTAVEHETGKRLDI